MTWIPAYAGMTEVGVCAGLTGVDVSALKPYFPNSSST